MIFQIKNHGVTGTKDAQVQLSAKESLVDDVLEGGPGKGNVRGISKDVVSLQLCVHCSLQ